MPQEHKLQVHGFRAFHQDCWTVVRLWATYKGKEFLSDISFENDGRDMETDLIWGDPRELVEDGMDPLYCSEKWPEIGKAMEACYKQWEAADRP
jgi:hypothetical protein